MGLEGDTRLVNTSLKVNRHFDTRRGRPRTRWLTVQQTRILRRVFSLVPDYGTAIPFRAALGNNPRWATKFGLAHLARMGFTFGMRTGRRGQTTIEPVTDEDEILARMDILLIVPSYCTIDHTKIKPNRKVYACRRHGRRKNKSKGS